MSELKTVEILARQLHEWYLEATDQDGAKYNHEAVVPYEDLPEGSKILDRYIAGKIIDDLNKDRADIARVLRERVEGLKDITIVDFHECYENNNKNQAITRVQEIIDELLGKE